MARIETLLGELDSEDFIGAFVHAVEVAEGGVLAGNGVQPPQYRSCLIDYTPPKPDDVLLLENNSIPISGNQSRPSVAQPSGKRSSKPFKLASDCRVLSFGRDII